MSGSLVVILMGSRSDEAHCQKIAGAARDLGLEVEIHIGSAHKTPRLVLNLLEKYEVDPRRKVYITVAGRSNALSGFVDAAVSAPVIACPPSSDSFGGADLFSSLRMPSGVAPAVVLDPSNAALLAAKILGLSDPDAGNSVRNLQKAQAEKIQLDDQALQK